MKYFLLQLLMLLGMQSRAQVNLVVNPGFEQHSLCPDNWDEIKYATGWQSLDSLWNPPDWLGDSSGIPEYLSVCAIYTTGGGVPFNEVYYNWPLTGNAMAEVQVFSGLYNSDPYLRDYLQGHLVNTLVAGQSYCVTFYVALEQGSQYAINHIGAYLDDGSIDTAHPYEGVHPEYTPQVLDTGIILDSIRMIPDTWTWYWKGVWTKIQGNFVANGTERLITIANFSDKAHTGNIPFGDTARARIDSDGARAWYLVDDVSVVASDAVAGDVGLPVTYLGGDTAYIGDTTDVLPVTWYVHGTAIDSNRAGIVVAPDSSTWYVMALSICGNTTYDSVLVIEDTISLGSRRAAARLNSATLAPNPTTGLLTITNGGGQQLTLWDMLGRAVYEAALMTDKQTIDISALPPGVYLAAIGQKRVKVVKE